MRPSDRLANFLKWCRLERLPAYLRDDEKPGCPGYQCLCYLVRCRLHSLYGL